MMGKKINIEEFIARANKKHNSKYDYSKVELINASTKVCIICPEHGEFWQTPTKHLQGQGCPKCAQIIRNKKKAYTQEEFEAKANIIHNSKYQYSNDYINGSTKIKILCPIHGYFSQIPYHHLMGEGCPKCAIEKNSQKQKMTIEVFVNKAKKIHNNKYDYTDSVYENYRKPLKIICPEHGEFWQSPDSHLHGHGCPKCGNQISFGEDELLNYLKTLLKEEIKSKDKNVISPYELDIYIPTKKLAIEYDGLIWHSEKFDKDRHYHVNKTDKCEEQGIRLIHVFEDEWLERKDIVKSKIKHIVGYDTDLAKVFARKCNVTEIDNNTSNTFLEKNHIQGKANATVYLGCFYGEELVGVMLFKKIGNIQNYELVRFATRIDKRCIGVGGKMFKYFVKKYNPTTIKSFADRRWSTTIGNTIYDKLGFSLESVLKPDYYYIDNNGRRIHKFLCRKQRLMKRYENIGLTMEMSEKEMCEKLKFHKIWNCGLLKYVWKKL